MWSKPQVVDITTLIAAPLDDSQWVELQWDRVDSLWQMLYPSQGTESTQFDHIPNNSIHMSSALNRLCVACCVNVSNNCPDLLIGRENTTSSAGLDTIVITRKG